MDDDKFIDEMMKEHDIEDSMKMVTKKEFMKMSAEVMAKVIDATDDAIEALFVSAIMSKYGAALTAELFDKE